MATEILAIGTNTTPSSDVTVEAGTPLTVAIKGSANGQVEIQLKDDDNNYWRVDVLDYGKRGVILAGPGTYRFLRRAGAAGAGVGVFSG